MGKRNNMVPNRHFHKDWQRYVKTWFDQPARKVRRRLKRQKRALRLAPRPEKGPLRPAVQCPSFRYNNKCRLGRGFSLQELKAARLNKNFAKSIGIAVDHRRRNKCYESIQKNKQRLQEYMNKLILLPHNEKKLQDYESPKNHYKNAVQLKGTVMPLPIVKKRTKWLKIDLFKDATSVYKILRVARRETRKTRTKKKKGFKVTDLDDKN